MGISSRVLVASFVVAGLFAVGAEAAWADLIEVDLVSGSGDGLITRDTDTGLEWLDLTATTGLSFSDTVASSWYVNHGFEHATTQQIETMMLHSALPATGTPVLNTIAAGATRTGAGNLLALMGNTHGPVEGWGYAANGPHSYDYYLARYGVVYNAYGQLQPGGGNTGLNGTGFSYIGHFLIRGSSSSPVPEPGTWALMGLGVLGLAYQRKRKTAKAS